MTTIVESSPGALGPVLREVRVAEAVTQTALANLAGVGRQWLNSFEMGDKPSAPIDMVMRVASALDVTLTLTPPSPPDRTTADDEAIDLDALLSEFDQ